MKVILIFSIAALASVVICFGLQSKGQTPHSVKTDYVPDKETAIKIAEAIWLPIYGKTVIDTEKPFQVRLVDSKIWIVKGTLKPNMFGGVAYIEIQKKDCKVLRVSHGK